MRIHTERKPDTSKSCLCPMLPWQPMIIIISFSQKLWSGC